MSAEEEKAEQILKPYAIANTRDRQALILTIASSIREAMRVQMKLDCIAICLDCRRCRPLDGNMHVWYEYGQRPDMKPYEQRKGCRATDIRHAWATHAPDAAGGDGSAAG